MRSEFEINRSIKIINEAIKLLSLNLKNRTVLTEAGSNYFIYTPFIAYLAGAEKVFVWIKDSPYGLAEYIKNEFCYIADFLQIPLNSFDFALNNRSESHVSSANIITNLGAIRPINKEFIDLMGKNSVISYMCESWEIRPNDVDISYCKSLNIPIAGVWENHPSLQIFDACGTLALKLCFEAGLEIYQNNILVVSSDKFGVVAANAFTSLRASKVEIIRPEQIDDYDLSIFDLIFIADYKYDKEIINNRLEFKIGQLKYCAIVHLCGVVDYEWLNNNEIFCYPTKNGQAFRMTQTLAYLGLNPLIKLHTAGLKVGELLWYTKTNELVQDIL